MKEWFRKLFGPYGPETKKVQLGFFFGSWVILAAVGLFIPEKALSENEWAWRFSDFMASIVPQIDRITALNLRPEVNKFHYSILWAVSPVFPGLMVPSFWKHPSADNRRKTYGQAVGGLLVCVWLIGFTMFLWWGLGPMGDPADRIERLMFYYGLSRAVTAPLMVFGFWMCVTMLLHTIWGLFTGYFHRAVRGDSHG